MQRLAEALDLPDTERERLEQAARAPASGCPTRSPGLATTLRPPGRAGRGQPGAVPHQLPRATPGFTGRPAELRTLTSLLDGASPMAGSAPAMAIVGTAGVGKTALAVHWAHQVAERFPDGQLFIDLKGFDPAAEPVSPGEAIPGFLSALGVRRAAIPAAWAEQVGLYRSVLAGRRMLIVLDNVRGADQVRPLLPGNQDSLAVVTSRHQLTGLVATEGACPLFLDLLTSREARDLLARRLGAWRLYREPQAADEVVRLCARLPLALTVAAARAATNPMLALGDLAADLGAPCQRLDVLDTGEPATSLRAKLASCYRLLTDGAARMFRLLGKHPDPDITVADAASLADVPAGLARAALRELASWHLVIERTPGCFSAHDILRAYAAEQADAASLSLSPVVSLLHECDAGDLAAEVIAGEPAAAC